MREVEHPSAYELQAFFDNELSPEDTNRIADHCKGCLDCRTTLVELKQVRMALSAIPSPKLSHTVWHRIAYARRHKELPLGRGYKLAMTAACAAGIVIGLVFGPVRLSPESRIHRTPDGALESVWAGDSSTSLLSVYSIEAK